MTSWVVRFDRRYAPVHSATIAWTRGPKPPVGTPNGDIRTGGRPAGRAEQPVQLILRHDRLHGGQVGHLMPVGLGILALQGC